jgi:hypothetical protein
MGISQERKLLEHEPSAKVQNGGAVPALPNMSTLLQDITIKTGAMSGSIVKDLL